MAVDTFVPEKKKTKTKTKKTKQYEDIVFQNVVSSSR